MENSLATSDVLVLPKELQAFFDAPPLLKHERREDYDALFLAIARAVRPVDGVEWVCTKEFADLSWEMRRERQIRCEIIELEKKEYAHIADMFKTTLSTSLSEAPQRKSEIEALDLERVAYAHIRGSGEIEASDRRMLMLEKMRSGIMKEMERRRDGMARRAERASSEIIDGEFTEAAE